MIYNPQTTVHVLDTDYLNMLVECFFYNLSMQILFFLLAVSEHLINYCNTYGIWRPVCRYLYFSNN